MPHDCPHILLCGVGPVPLSDMSSLFAPGLRLWVFSRALLRAGCRLSMLEVRFGAVDSGASLHTVRLNPDWRPGESAPYKEFLAETAPIPPGPPEALVERALAAAAPIDAIVASCDVMNCACALACGDIPLWCDYNGHPMTERQGLARVYDSDGGLAAQWDDLLPALLRADRFSAVSPAQRLALLGELGACGRLNRHTDGLPLVSSLPLVPVFPHMRATEKPIHGRLIPADAFAVLWTGGYNTWADVDTLAGGLIEAMITEPRMHYVSTGGAIHGHDGQTFSRFRQIIDASPIAARCHFVGWVRTDEVPNYYLDADVAVSCDRWTLEGELGARNRVMDWACAGLPVVSTDLCELTHWFAERGLITVIEPANPSALADALLRHAANARAMRERAAQARETLLRERDACTLFAPMTDWARDPARAPDLADPARINGAPFALPDNLLAIRRAREWVASRQAENPAPVAGLLARIRRGLGRLRL